MPTHPAPRRLRGCAVGASAASLAVAAHGIAGGGYPNSTALTLLLIAGTAIGAVAAAARGGPLAVIGLLGAGQLASHLALTVALHHETAATGPMLGAHLVATLVCAALIVGAEELCKYLAARLAAAAQRINAPPRPRRFTWIDRGHRVSVAVDPRGPISRRGPPVAA